jgi:ribosomal protein S18 acetylase RimI-like enzyme
MPAKLSIHTATDEDFLAVIGLFEAALLDVEADRLRALLTDTAPGFVLLATTTGRPSDGRSTDRRPVGAIAVDTAAHDTKGRHTATHDTDSRHTADPQTAHIVAIAVRPQRRDRGIGRALVERAADRVAPRPLSAAFEASVRPFYHACGFDIEPRDGRLWGIRYGVDGAASGSPGAADDDR